MIHLPQTDSNLAAERQVEEKKLQANIGARARSLDWLVRCAEGRQYEGRPSFWDDSVPLMRRAPCVVYPAAMLAANSYGSLILGEGRFRGLTTHREEDDEAFDERLGLSPEDSAHIDKALQRALREGRIGAAMRVLLYLALVGKTSCAVMHLRKGVACLDVLDAKWCVPTFENGPGGDVVSVDLRYPYLHEFKDASGNDHVECRMYRRVIDAVADTVFVPMRATQTGLYDESSWRVETSTPHGLGFCPVVWYRHEPSATVRGTIDGTAIHQELCDEIDALNFALSIRHRAAVMLGDPMIWETGVQEGTKRAPTGIVWQGEVEGPGTSDGKGYNLPNVNSSWGRYVNKGGSGTMKGPGTIWSYDSPDAKVGILGLEAGALKPIEEDADDLLAIVAEGMSWVPTDPKQMSLGTSPSGRAFEWLHKKQIEACGTLREDFAHGVLLPVASMILRAIATLPPERLRIGGAVKAHAILQRFFVEMAPAENAPPVPTRTEWIAPFMSPLWGAYFAPTEADAKAVSEMVRADYQAGIISRQTAVEKLAPFYGIADAAAYVEELEREDEDREEAVRALQAAAGKGAPAPEPEEDDDAREALAQVKPGAKKAPAKKAREAAPVVPLRRRTKKAA